MGVSSIMIWRGIFLGLRFMEEVFKCNFGLVNCRTGASIDVNASSPEACGNLLGVLC